MSNISAIVIDRDDKTRERKCGQDACQIEGWVLLTGIETLDRGPISLCRTHALKVIEVLGQAVGARIVQKREAGRL